MELALQPSHSDHDDGRESHARLTTHGVAPTISVDLRLLVVSSTVIRESVSSADSSL
jgi:hypothetical protein